MKSQILKGYSRTNEQHVGQPGACAKERRRKMQRSDRFPKLQVVKAAFTSREVALCLQEMDSRLQTKLELIEAKARCKAAQLGNIQRQLVHAKSRGSL
jgi:hypothetical protein